MELLFWRSKVRGLKAVCPRGTSNWRSLTVAVLRRCFVSDTQVEVKGEGGGAKWPAGEGGGVGAPVTQAALANAAARASASQSRRELAEYLRLRRKSA
jgi:hypothetical protein